MIAVLFFNIDCQGLSSRRRHCFHVSLTILAEVAEVRERAVVPSSYKPNALVVLVPCLECESMLCG